MLKLSRDLLDQLYNHNISYCSWKDNFELNEALDGMSDLDLLVHRNDFSCFISVLQKLLFKKAYQKHITYPDVSHFYGLDIESGQILHLHVYTRVITGESHIKNYHLPLEKMLLENSIRHETGCRIPILEVELMLYVFRYYIKTSCLPGHVLLKREKKDSEKEQAYISSEFDYDLLCELLKKYIPCVSIKYFKVLLDSVVKGNSECKNIFYGLLLRRKLANFSRYNPCSAFCVRYYQIIYRALNKLIFRQKKLLTDGGAIIAITGLDSTGKSTMVNCLAQWLGKNFSVKSIHVGRPGPTMLTFPARVTLRIRKKIIQDNEIKYQTTGHEKPSTIISALRYMILSYERFKVLKKAEKWRLKGHVVICDRFPSLKIGKMDSPRVQFDPEKKSLINILSKIEQRYYAMIPVPDMIFNLIITFDEAVKRNEKRVKEGKESFDELKLRYEINNLLPYEAGHFETIDATISLEAVTLNMKNKVWHHL